MSYEKMAQVYDQLMSDAPYDEWVSFTEEMIKRYHRSKVSSMLELGCGTGEITHRMNREGYVVTGVDLSEDMLTIAQQKDPGAGIQWLHQDITELQGLECFDCVISYCDVMNYVTKSDDLQKVIGNAFHSLKESGLFMFDVHSVDHIENDLLGATFAEVYDDLSYIWFCDPGDKENHIVHDLTFFVQSGGAYERFDEQHYQRGYTVTELTEWIEEAGFTLKQISADFNLEPSSSGERIFFICQK